jgi:hypothetical protein
MRPRGFSPSARDWGLHADSTARRPRGTTRIPCCRDARETPRRLSFGPPARPIVRPRAAPGGARGVMDAAGGAGMHGLYTRPSGWDVGAVRRSHPFVSWRVGAYM